MFLNIIWIIPAILFSYRFWREPRSLWTGHLFTFTMLMFLATIAGLSIVSVEQYINQRWAIGVALAFLALIPLSIALSTIYLLFNGRQMIVYEGRRLANLLSLLYGLAVILAFALHFLPTHPVIRWISGALDFTVFYGSFLYLSHWLYSIFYNNWPLGYEPDYIIVLGSGLIGDKVPPLLAQRLDKAYTVYENYDRKPTIIVSGGQGSDEVIPEGLAMARYLENKGIDRDKLLMEQESRTTFENLTFSRKLMEDKDAKVLVVTNSFHALRAGIYMKRIKMKGRSIGSRTAAYFMPSALIREDIALAKMFWKTHAILLSLIIFPSIIGFAIDGIHWILTHLPK